MLNEATIRQITTIRDDLAALSNDMDVIAHKASESTYRCVSSDLSSALIRVEKETTALRSLIARLSPLRSCRQEDALIAESEINITEDCHWIKISMPAILPGKNRKKAPPYLLRPLQNALAEYVRENDRPLFQRCIVAIEHEYDAALGSPRYIDYDNIEVKGIIDVITSRLLTDDTSKLVHTHHSTITSDKDRLTLYVMSQYSFHNWVEMRYSSRP